MQARAPAAAGQVQPSACVSHTPARLTARPLKFGQRVVDAELIGGSLPWWKVDSLEEWLAKAEALPAQGRGLSDDIAALLALKGLSRSAADQAAADTLSRAASALVALAEHAAGARSPTHDDIATSMQCLPCRASAG
jgi:hypothetical protein